MISLRKCKKGGILFDNWAVIIFLFVFILFLAFTSLIWYHLNAEIQAMPVDIIDSVTKQRVNDMGKIFSFIDRMIPFIFMLFWLLTLFFSSTLSPTHPIFFVLSFITLLVLSLVSIFLVDFYEIFFSNSVFNVVNEGLSNSLFFAGKFHLISFFIMIFSLVIFYSRNKMSKEVGIQ